jgi:hypothetical protein
MGKSSFIREISLKDGDTVLKGAHAYSAQF